MTYVYLAIMILGVGYLYVNLSVINKNINHIHKENETFLEDESNSSQDPI